jgi:uncharacterized protein (TIGR00369 family)
MGSPSELVPPFPGINCTGFIDHSDGSFVRAGAAEAGAPLLRRQPLPPATRVFVSGVHPATARVSIEALEPGRLVCRSAAAVSNLRPGGTVSGPTMMALVDTAAYCLVLACSGPLALAVTSQFSIHFLRKPQLRDLIATATVLRLGRRQMVCTVELHSDGDVDPVEHATVTYAIPAAG